MASHYFKVVKLLAAVVMALGLNSANADLGNGTIWHEAGEPYGISAELLYAIAIQESKVGAGDGVQAWPWRLRVSDKGYRYDSYREAVEALEAFVSKGTPSWQIDVGIMQLNLYWAYKWRKYDKHYSLGQLLDPRINIGIGAAILSESVKGVVSVEGIGAYHNPEEPRRSAYGKSVMDIYQSLVGQKDAGDSTIW